MAMDHVGAVAAIMASAADEALPDDGPPDEAPIGRRLNIFAGGPDDGAAMQADGGALAILARIDDLAGLLMRRESGRAAALDERIDALAAGLDAVERRQAADAASVDAPGTAAREAAIDDLDRRLSTALAEQGDLLLDGLLAERERSAAALAGVEDRLARAIEDDRARADARHDDLARDVAALASAEASLAGGLGPREPPSDRATAGLGPSPEDADLRNVLTDLGNVLHALVSRIGPAGPPVADGSTRPLLLTGRIDEDVPPAGDRSPAGRFGQPSETATLLPALPRLAGDDVPGALTGR